MTRWLNLLVGGLGGLALLLAVASVAMRYLAPAWAFDWSDEVVVMLLVWAMFLAGYRLTIQRAHVAVDLLTHGRSPAWRRRLDVASTLGLIAYAGGLLVCGVLVVADALRLGERTESTARIPTFLYYAALPAGMALIVVAAVLVLAGRGEARGDAVEPL